MWVTKQTVISRSEPELGLGTITKVDTDEGILEALFIQSGESRRYSAATAPIQRFCLQVGEDFRGPEGQDLKVEEVRTVGDYFQYVNGEEAFWEYEVEACPTDHSGVIDRLLGGELSHHKTYELRREAWEIRGKAGSQTVRGLVGARVNPLPHQLYIAHQVSRRPFPRVLLADEVGLGKTIEAGLIYSAMKALGRADRVLIVTPESLTHQWMAEIFRRFGDMFSVLNAKRCDEEQASQGISPFQLNQRALVSMDFLIQNPERLSQACSAYWDLIIIDEAHHLDWDEEEPNEGWIVAKSLSKACRALLLLTATPRQHGLATQFGLLNLVDPDRYSDFDEFLDEADNMRSTAEIAKSLVSEQWSESLCEKLCQLFAQDPEVLESLKKQHELGNIEFKSLIQNLVDRHGTGRVLFRNRRERLKGFPKRVLHSVELAASNAYKAHLSEQNPDEVSDLHLMDYATGRGLKRSFTDNPAENPRFLWLRSFMQEVGEEKALVICANKEKVLEIQDYLEEIAIQSGQNSRVAVFHEDLSIIERDREAASFADPKGAKLLISSEIGGEGRNFQFASKLVLLDLPRLPDLLEQRIGRLDRIGQKKPVEIYVPWLKDTPEEVLFNWYHQGLNSYEVSWNGADPLLEVFVEDLLFLFRAYLPKHAEHKQRKQYLDILLKRTQKQASQLKQERSDSIDVLLDLNSFDPEHGEKLLDLVEDVDDDPQLEFFMRAMFEHYGIDYEELDDRGSLVVRAESLSFIDRFPGIAEDKDTLLTFDRSVALEREDILFLSLDHPMVEGCLSLLLDRGEGVSSICKWQESPHGTGMIIEVSLVLEAVGAKHLELGSYLPLAVKEFCLDHRGKSIKQKDYKQEPQLLSEMSEEELPFDRAQMRTAIQPLLEKIINKADNWVSNKKEKAIKKAKAELSSECERLEYLAKINPSISSEEIAILEQYEQEVIRHIESAKVRLDNLRLIFTY
ncbi:MAG: RNA polymerase-associated protein RapA [Oligoflexales bacterium]|nr:RNA polymerase-associated protein RapA [Oligoflexales bacterium]